MTKGAGPEDADRVAIEHTFSIDRAPGSGSNIVISTDLPLDPDNGLSTILTLAERFKLRGHSVSFMDPSDMTVLTNKGEITTATACTEKLESVKCGPPTWIPGRTATIEPGTMEYKLADRQKQDLTQADLIIYLREPGQKNSNEPLQLLAILNDHGVPVLNNPRALQLNTSKTMLCKVSPHTMYSQDATEIKSFIDDTIKEGIVKPLGESTGKGIKRRRSAIDGESASSSVSDYDYDTYRVIQEKLEGIKTNGDHSVWVAGGKPICGMKRVLGKKSTASADLANLAHGGELGAYVLQKADMENIQAAADALAEAGIEWGRIDFIRAKIKPNDLIGSLTVPKEHRLAEREISGIEVAEGQSVTFEKSEKNGPDQISALLIDTDGQLVGSPHIIERNKPKSGNFNEVNANLLGKLHPTDFNFNFPIILAEVCALNILQATSKEFNVKEFHVDEKTWKPDAEVVDLAGAFVSTCEKIARQEKKHSIPESTRHETPETLAAIVRDTKSKSSDIQEVLDHPLVSGNKEVAYTVYTTLARRPYIPASIIQSIKDDDSNPHLTKELRDRIVAREKISSPSAATAAPTTATPPSSVGLRRRVVAKADSLGVHRIASMLEYISHPQVTLRRLDEKLKDRGSSKRGGH